MSNSLNSVSESNNIYVKTYGKKKPLWKYNIRSFINNIGFSQPVEYYDISKRISFEVKVLKLWKSFGLEVPDVIKVENNKLYLCKIDGLTIDEIFSEKNSYNKEIIEKIVEDMNKRHFLAIEKNEASLCHVDSNLRNIMYSDGKIIHIDFEMGRENEPIDKWMEREVSKLLVSLLKSCSLAKREEILGVFIKYYKKHNIIEKMISNKLKKRKKKKEKTNSLYSILSDLDKLMKKTTKYNINFEVNKILFIYSARFGDILMSTPCVKAIHEKWPNAKITFLTHPKRTEILEKNKIITTLGSIDKFKIKFDGFLNWNKYDLAFALNKEEKSFVKYALRVSKHVIAFNTKDLILNKKLFYGIDYPKQHSKHSVDMRLELLSKLNIEPSSKKLLYKVDKDESIWANKYLLEELKLENKLIIGVQANSFHTKGFRDWPISNFIDLCKMILSKNTNVHFLLFGSNDDVANVSKINESLPSNSSLLAGKLSLRQTASIMSLIDLYIGVDTGPTHIMGTMNKAMIVLYHSFASSSLLKPLENPNFISIDHPHKEHGENKSDMSDISVSDVYEKVEYILKNRGDNK